MMIKVQWGITSPNGGFYEIKGKGYWLTKNLALKKARELNKSGKGPCIVTGFNCVTANYL